MGISADSLADQGTPQLVKNEDGTDVLSDILAIAAGGYTDSATFALALDKDGQVYGWGSNDRGQIMKASDRYFALPKKTLMRRAIDIAAGQASTSYALCADGTVAAWGNNYSYEYGTVNNGIN